MTQLFRKPAQPVDVNDLRSKTWKTLPGLVAPDSPIWQKRAQQYWTLQARLYGWRLSPFTILVDDKAGHVSTYAVVLEILPGKRTAEHWKVPVESAGVERLAVH